MAVSSVQEVGGDLVKTPVAVPGCQLKQLHGAVASAAVLQHDQGHSGIYYCPRPQRQAQVLRIRFRDVEPQRQPQRLGNQGRVLLHGPGA
jgi:hypothetical protein